MPFDRYQTMPMSARKNDENVFEYWQTTCAMHDQFHARHLPFGKTNVRDFFGFLDQVVTALGATNCHASADLDDKAAVSIDNLELLRQEIGKVYQLSVDQWHLSMKKLRSFT